MQPDDRLHAAINFIADTRAQLAEGKVVVLEGFQYEVEAIHHLIGAMPPTEAKKYRPFITKLIEDLDVLKVELVEQQHKVQQEIFSLNRRQKALKSYETSKHSGGEDGNQ